MIYYKDNKFHNELYKAEIQVSNHKLISYIHDKEWYEEVKLRTMNISKDEIIYEDLVFTEEQLFRLNEINEFGCIEEKYTSYVVNYVIDGLYPEFDNHPLRLFQLEKENKLLKLELSNVIANLKKE